MEANWTIEVKGESHAVKACIPAFSLWPRITVYLDGAVAHKQALVALLGELCRFNVLGHELTIRLNGFGLLGSLGLLIDGVEAAHSLAGMNQNRQPSQVLYKVLDTSQILETSIVETERMEEHLGNEMREIDNSHSKVGIQRTIRVSREWVQSCVVERETTAKVGGELSVGKAWVVDLKATAEGAVRKKYELKTEERKSYSEELTIEVPANTKVQVVLKWKQLWQCGVVLVRSDKDGAEARIPFKVCIGPTFDQCQVDG